MGVDLTAPKATPARSEKNGARGAFLSGLLALALLGVFAIRTTAQQPGPPKRLPFAPAEQEAYLDGLIRGAPSDWPHGKNWVLIQPLLVGRNVTQPISRTVCPDAGIADPTTNEAQIPKWIYSAPGICEELSATHDAALLVLEDPNDMDAAYFFFLACDPKKRKDPCDMDGYYQQYGMKLAESEKRGRREFEALVPNLEGKTSHFLIPEIWHMRNPQPDSNPSNP